MTEPVHLSIPSIIEQHSNAHPDAPAVMGLSKPPLTYRGLSEQVNLTRRFLGSHGVNRGDCVAVVVPNGPEMAAVFLAVASSAVCAPLNPGYAEEEFEFYFSDLDAKALIIQPGASSEAVTVAERLGVKVFSLNPLQGREAGRFELGADEEEEADGDPAPAQPSHTALILHTSGTTARPKMVPLTHLNLCTSAQSIMHTLRLTPGDSCLNVMPLFHIHGLVGALLSTITAGGSIVCTPGFNRAEFYSWVKTHDPTWYSAVPTIHQSVLADAEKNRDVITGSRLRLIRSSSSALPPQVLHGVEEAFNVPMIEAYGMTEAAHQIASNPLPPGKRKPRSVGTPTGPEISIIDGDSASVPSGARGEIAIRGPSVTGGYLNNPEANRGAYTGGWFRTGDEGYIDEDGYLFITDRLKEIINRGGEKVSPREVDEVLLDHPHVAQAVTFPLPDPLLGEEVVAAVVADEDGLTEWDIQRYVASRLADHKVPRRVIFLKSIPKGPTGKTQRVKMAETLDLTPRTEAQEEPRQEYVEPRKGLEREIASVWEQVLNIPKVGVRDNYFQLGGDSLRGEEIVTILGKRLDVGRIPLVVFLHAPTVEKMAQLLQGELPDWSVSLVKLQPQGYKTPIYLTHACKGEVLFFQHLVKHMGEQRPIYALRSPGLDGEVSYGSVEEYAEQYMEEILQSQGRGPYIVGGAGLGGVIGMEIAHQLRAKGMEVALLLLIDSIPLIPPRRLRGAEKLRVSLERLRFYALNGQLWKLTWVSVDRVYRKLAMPYRPRIRVNEAHRHVVQLYKPKVYDGRTLLFMSERRFSFPDDPSYRIDMWDGLLTGKLDVHVVPGEHLRVLQEPNVQTLSRLLREYLEDVQ